MLGLKLINISNIVLTPKCVPRSIKDIFIDGNKIMEVT